MQWHDFFDSIIELTNRIRFFARNVMGITFFQDISAPNEWANAILFLAGSDNIWRNVSQFCNHLILCSSEMSIDDFEAIKLWYVRRATLYYTDCDEPCMRVSPSFVECTMCICCMRISFFFFFYWINFFILFYAKLWFLDPCCCCYCNNCNQIDEDECGEK